MIKILHQIWFCSNIHIIHSYKEEIPIIIYLWANFNSPSGIRHRTFKLPTNVVPRLPMYIWGTSFIKLLTCFQLWTQNSFFNPVFNKIYQSSCHKLLKCLSHHNRNSLCNHLPFQTLRHTYEWQSKPIFSLTNWYPSCLSRIFIQYSRQCPKDKCCSLWSVLWKSLQQKLHNRVKIMK